MNAKLPGFGVPSFHVDMDLASFLRNPFMSIDGEMRLIEGIQRFAEERLVAACRRIRIPIGDIEDDVDRTLTAYWSVKEAPKATASDLQACELFDVCVDALGRRRLDQYGRDRIILAFSRLDDDLKAVARKHKAEQAARRKGKPASADDPLRHGDRNAEIKRHHARLVDQGRHDATAETARQFRLDPRSIRRILKK